MTRPPISHAALPVLLAGALLLAACNSSGSASPSEAAGTPTALPTATPTPVTGALKISGSSTVEPITSIVAEDFKALNPGVDYEVKGPGTGDGFKLLCSGDIDIADASRAIKDAEAQACTDAGIHVLGLQVGIDGISVITSTANTDVTCLSFLDLYALLGPESQGFSTWSDANALAGQLDATKYGASHAPYFAKDLTVTAPGEESGTYDSFVEFAIKAQATDRTKDVVTRPDYQTSANDNTIISGVAGGTSDQPGTLGWVGFAFADQNRSTVNLLEIDGGKGCVAPTVDTIASNEYPMSRPLFIYVNLDKAATNPVIPAFVDYYLTDAGIAAVSEADYIDVDATVLAATRAAWEGR